MIEVLFLLHATMALLLSAYSPDECLLCAILLQVILPYGLMKSYTIDKFSLNELRVWVSELVGLDSISEVLT